MKRGLCSSFSTMGTAPDCRTPPVPAGRPRPAAGDRGAVRHGVFLRPQTQPSPADRTCRGLPRPSPCRALSLCPCTAVGPPASQDHLRGSSLPLRQGHEDQPLALFCGVTPAPKISVVTTLLSSFHFSLWGDPESSTLPRDTLGKDLPEVSHSERG